MITTRSQRIIMAFALSIVLEVILWFIFTSVDSKSIIYRLSVALGGNFIGGGYIQWLTFLAFYWGMFEVLWNLKLNKKERKFFEYPLLPKEEFQVLETSEVNQIRIKVAEYLREHKNETERKFYLINLINKACIKFRSNLSVSETFEVVTAQCRINATKAESGHSIIRYLAWAIPSVGFVGTVLGISQALGIANSGEIEVITATLGVAFDTTLIALILSLVLMLFIHQLQEDTEHLHLDIEEYVVENLINRIDVN